MVKFFNSRIKECVTKNSLLCRNTELLLWWKDKQQCLDFTSISNEAYFKIISSIPLNVYSWGKWNEIQ